MTYYFGRILSKTCVQNVPNSWPPLKSHIYIISMTLLLESRCDSKKSKATPLDFARAVHHQSHLITTLHLFQEGRRQPKSLWSTVKIRRTRVPRNAIVPVGGLRPYSIIILNMRFIPEASLRAWRYFTISMFRASSQITAGSYILERHLWVKNSKPFALTPTWSMACKQTDCITAGMWKLPDSERKTFVWLYAMLDQRRRRWADVV